MSIRRLSNEHLLYLLALVLAGFVRFFRLGAAPLSDFEAGWALQALELAGQGIPGLDLPLGPQPAYGLLTGALFALFGATTFLARFLPVLAGTLLVLAPALFQRQLGRPAALILAFGLALDPTLTTVSRLAGGPMPALGFGLLALGLWLSRRPVLAGLFGGLALLSGPEVFNSALALGLAALALYVISGPADIPSPHTTSHSPLTTPHSPLTTHHSPLTTSHSPLRRALYSLGAAVLLIGTLFFWAPQGLAALASGLAAYLSGWAAPSGVSGLKILAALAFYGLLPLLFALVSAARLALSRRSSPDTSSMPPWTLRRTGLFLLLWAAAALLVALLYPARQVTALAWVLVPLWGLAALELARHLPRPGVTTLAAAQAALIVILLGLFYLTLAGMARSLPGAPGSGLRLGIMAGILALILLTSLLLALGWNWDAGRLGLVWGLAIGLGLGSLSTLWGAAHLRQNSPLELFSPLPAPGQERLLLDTARELSSWNTGFTNQIEIHTNVGSPALLWALRGFPNLKVSQGAIGAGLDLESQPPVLITTQQESSPALSASYRGQDFVWWVSPGWSGPLPQALAPWIVSREAPLNTEKIILWARSDLFPGSAP